MGSLDPCAFDHHLQQSQMTCMQCLFVNFHAAKVPLTSWSVPELVSAEEGCRMHEHVQDQGWFQGPSNNGTLLWASFTYDFHIFKDSGLGVRYGKLTDLYDRTSHCDTQSKWLNHLKYTPWKFNIAPENIASQKESSLPTIIFQGLC